MTGVLVSPGTPDVDQEGLVLVSLSRVVAPDQGSRASLSSVGGRGDWESRGLGEGCWGRLCTSREDL